MNTIQLPQMRVLVTDYCDSKCVYCRPSGEGNLKCKHRHIKYDTATKAAFIYRECGGTEIKISGGDPVFWPYLCEYVRYLKNDLRFEHVELITRSTKITKIVDSLIDENLDVLNFSLDTINPNRYNTITGKKDFNDFIQAIKYCSSRLFCKINMVVLKDTTVEEVDDMINFCIQNGIRELKLLDYIDDLHEDPRCGKEKQTEWFQSIYKKLDNISSSKDIIFQGGLGHPMSVYSITDKFRAICKDASKGAWYSSYCLNCQHYPCHDALMALRVTPDNSFQLCLLNNRMHWRFNTDNMEEQFHSILFVFQNAFFMERGANEDNSVNSP